MKLWQWLNPNKESTIPPGATFNVGACAVLIDAVAGNVLVVENVRRSGSWNFPGGNVKPGETRKDGAIRELLEETGLSLTIKGGEKLSSAARAGGLIKAFEALSTRPSMIVGEMEFPENQFARAINFGYAFFADLTPRTMEVEFQGGVFEVDFGGAAVNPPADEIKQARWIPAKSFLQEDETVEGLKYGPEISSYIRTAVTSLGFGTIQDKGWMVVSSAMSMEP